MAESVVVHEAASSLFRIVGSKEEYDKVLKTSASIVDTIPRKTSKKPIILHSGGEDNLPNLERKYAPPSEKIVPKLYDELDEENYKTIADKTNGSRINITHKAKEAEIKSVCKEMEQLILRQNQYDYANALAATQRLKTYIEQRPSAFSLSSTRPANALKVIELMIKNFEDEIKNKAKIADVENFYEHVRSTHQEMVGGFSSSEGMIDFYRKYDPVADAISEAYEEKCNLSMEEEQALALIEQGKTEIEPLMNEMASMLLTARRLVESTNQSRESFSSEKKDPEIADDIAIALPKDQDR